QTAIQITCPRLPETVHRERCSYAAWFKHGDGIGINHFNHFAMHFIFECTATSSIREQPEFAMTLQNNNENLHDFMLSPCAPLFVHLAMAPFPTPELELELELELECLELELESSRTQPPTPTPPFPTAESGVGVRTPNRLQTDSAESPGLQPPPPPPECGVGVGVGHFMEILSWSDDGDGAVAASGSGARTIRWTSQQGNMFASLAVKCVAECAGKPNFSLGDLLAAEAQKHSVALGRKMSSQQVT
ncbi:hypothetical protein QJQ45_019234, partial [Haematococcus lacustris]